VSITTQAVVLTDSVGAKSIIVAKWMTIFATLEKGEQTMLEEYFKLGIIDKNGNMASLEKIKEILSALFERTSKK
jgi:hypothetical protein